MPFTVLYDANVLYPSTLRDVLIRVAMAGLVQAKWTDTILDETFSHLKANRPDLEPGALDRTRELMNASVRDVLVTGFEPLIAALELPDADDRHVLAAAIRAKAQVIVTANLRDFPDSVLSAWDVEARHPDDFLLDQFHIDALSLHRVIQDIANAWREPDASRAYVTSLRRPRPRRLGPRRGSSDGRERRRQVPRCHTGLIVVFMVGDVVGGVLASSLALLADAGHMLTNAATFLLGIVAGGALSARTADGFWVRGEEPVRYLQLAAGGLLLGAGGWIAGGCNLGHGLSGVAQLNISSLVVVAAIVGGVWLTRMVADRLSQQTSRARS